MENNDLYLDGMFIFNDEIDISIFNNNRFIVSELINSELSTKISGNVKVYDNETNNYKNIGILRFGPKSEPDILYNGISYQMSFTGQSFQLYNADTKQWTNEKCKTVYFENLDYSKETNPEILEIFNDFKNSLLNYGHFAPSIIKKDVILTESPTSEDEIYPATKTNLLLNNKYTTPFVAKTNENKKIAKDENGDLWYDGGGTNVVMNNGQPTTDTAKTIQVNDVNYNLPIGAGDKASVVGKTLVFEQAIKSDVVVANNGEPTTENLSTLKIGEKNYKVGGGGGDGIAWKLIE